jgi:5'-3' exonuclease
MGIPVFFKTLVQSHKQIMRPIEDVTRPDMLYLDANSIIYDAVRECERVAGFATDTLVIDETINRIRVLCDTINPRTSTLVAFDGVAPYGKMVQQRERRWKSVLLSANSSNWDTTKITPGTDFMAMLDERTRIELKGCAIVSGTSEPGEGEHKIFSRIREDPGQTVGVYGLDADLIVLGLLHVKHCKKLLLYRETPVFIKQIDASLEPDKSYVMDIGELELRILASIIGTTTSTGYIDDYVLASFFLGNDFMPHFAGLSLRCKGMDTVINSLRKLWKANRRLVLSREICWSSVKMLVNDLSKSEEKSVRAYRNKSWSLHADDEPINALPLLDRRLEEEIHAGSKGWRSRYYRLLNRSNDSDAYVCHLCKDYCRSLKWCFDYYWGYPVSWRYAFGATYPPLLVDLEQHVEEPELLIEECGGQAVDPKVQLAFVLPRHRYYLLPSTLAEILEDVRPAVPVRITWAYCRYFWESHIEFEDGLLDDCIKAFETFRAKSGLEM